MNGGEQNRFREQDGPAHLLDGLGDDLEQVVFAVALLFQSVQDVFDDDDGAVHNDAEINRAERNQVGRDTAQIQQQECAQQRKWNDDGDDQCGAVVAETEEEDEDEHDKADAFDHVLARGVEGALRQIRAVVMRR